MSSLSLASPVRVSARRNRHTCNGPTLTSKKKIQLQSPNLQVHLLCRVHLVSGDHQGCGPRQFSWWVEISIDASLALTLFFGACQNCLGDRQTILACTAWPTGVLSGGQMLFFFHVFWPYGTFFVFWRIS